MSKHVEDPIIEGKKASDAPSQAYRRELALLEAIEYGQFQRANRFLNASNIDIDFVDGTGRAAIHLAAQNGYIDLVRALISAGCDVDACSRTYGTALCLAASRPHSDVVKVLLDAGADVKAPGGGYGSALHAACRGGSLELVDMFLQCGLAVNVVRTVDMNVMRDERLCAEWVPPKYYYLYHQLQPIHAAAFFDHTAVVSKLMDLGAVIHAPYKSWFSEEAFQTFDDVDEQHRTDGLTPLHAACYSGRDEMTEFLLRKGADPWAQPSAARGKPLDYAARGGNSRCISMLLDAGVPVNASTIEGWTALFSAVYRNNPRCAELLISRGADVEGKTEGGATPLYHAKQPEMVEILVRHGASLKYQLPQTGTLTPLQHAAGWQDDGTKVIEKMIDLGAPVNHKSSYGATALYFAIKKQQKQNALTLLRCGADPKELTREYRGMLDTLTGYVPEPHEKRMAVKKDSESGGLFRRLLSRQKSHSTKAETQDNREARRDDDEKTLYSESIREVCKSDS